MPGYLFLRGTHRVLLHQFPPPRYVLRPRDPKSHQANHFSQGVNVYSDSEFVTTYNIFGHGRDGVDGEGERNQLIRNTFI